MRSMILATLCLSASVVVAEDTPDYTRDVAPIFVKYCVGCHNPEDRDGGLSLAAWSDLQQGGENGRVVLPGGAESSRLLRLVTGEEEPRMPPEDNEAPTPEEVRILRAWIAGGAAGPRGTQPDRTLRTPKLPAAPVAKPITAMDWSPHGQRVALGRFGQVVVVTADHLVPRWRVAGLAGKVNSIRYSTDGRWLVVATGVTGISGTAVIYDADRGVEVARFPGHDDTLYAAVISPDRSVLATAGYDHRIQLWDVASRRKLRTLSGHNGAVFDLDFSPDGTLLASASADETIKVWNVASGQRLDTRSEPLDEQYAVRFSPDGKLLLGGGADNRIRIWRVESRQQPAINPLLFARFGHEGPVTMLRFSADGRQLVSAADDRSIKVWETQTYTPIHAFETQPETVSGMAISPAADRLLVARMDGSKASYPIRLPRPPFVAKPAKLARPGRAAPSAAAFRKIAEKEPNNSAAAAQAVTAPSEITGVIDGADGDAADRDLFRFAARAGEVWVLEVHAERDKSELDSHVAVLTADGRPVPRVLLQAVRDSYFTFRGKDSNTIDDFRLHHWEEMELNQYLYANGEVARLWLYPRGPDSGFKVYPGRGRRYGFFDTTPLSHALHEPCYIVEPWPPETELVPNGLPTFTLNFENDDDARRRLGKDSKLFFTAPTDGQYIVRVMDTRGFAGPGFRYRLSIRPPQPGFQVKLAGANPTVNAGSGREFSVSAERIDGFEGPIRIDISGLPAGFHATSPLIIEAGQEVAFGTIHAEADAKSPSEDQSKSTVVTATAFVNGERVVQPVGSLGSIKLAAKPKLLVMLEPMDASGEWSPERPWELTIAPGETITARVRVQRNGFTGRVDFGKDDSGRNLPHGVYVDNIGLNGLMIVQGQTEREFFITAAPWVPETTRTFHLRATAEGGQCSWPVLLHVRQRDPAVAGPGAGD